MFSRETKIMLLTARMNMLNQRDPVANFNIIRKIKRQLRKLEN